MHAEGTDMSVTQSGDVSEQVGCPVKRGPYGKHQFKFPARRMFYAFSFSEYRHRPKLKFFNNHVRKKKFLTNNLITV
uniref:Uncharacterized protein n=1 Tax=Anguilla anguilla TaxID=7936 RepID=A0A0E9PNH1_ANGAN